MKIQNIDSPPIDTIVYHQVASDRSIKKNALPLLAAHVDKLPSELQAIVATSDLQGRDTGGDDPRLLAEMLTDKLLDLCKGDILPPAKSIGILLAVDLFSIPKLDKKGGKGDVRQIWARFATDFRWVVGVAGNHDGFGSMPMDIRKLHADHKNLHVLDETIFEVDGLRIAGVSGIIDNPLKPFRRNEETYVRAVERMLRERPDILVLHEGPYAPGVEPEGLPAVREVILQYPKTLVIRGHKFWKTPLAELHNGTQVLNVNPRVVFLKRKTMGYCL
jgi:Icc protein